MPLKKGSSKKTISKNVKELVKSKASSTRSKGVATIARNRGISKGKAKQVQAVAIAYNKAGNSSKPTPKQTAMNMLDRGMRGYKK